MSCLAPNSSNAASLPLQLDEVATRESPVDNYLLDFFINLPSTSNALLPIIGATAPRESQQNLCREIVPFVSGERFQLCSKCSSGFPVLYRCSDCFEHLCENCAKVQQCGNTRKYHNISSYPPNPISPPNTARSSSPNSSVLSGSSTNAVSFCDKHREPELLLCQTCMSAICTECLTDDHPGHIFSYFPRTVELAKKTTERLFLDAQAAIQALTEARETVQLMWNKVEENVVKAVTEIKLSVKSCIRALKQREQELLRNLEQARHIKTRSLKFQMKNLSLARTKLIGTSTILRKCSFSTNLRELMLVNDQSSEQLKQFSISRPNFFTCEDDGIMFSSTKNELLGAIRLFGRISNSPKLSHKMLKPAPAVQKALLLPTIRHGFLHSLKTQAIHGTNRIRVKRTSGYPSVVIGGTGNTNGLLSRPWGVCCDHLGNIIVADRGNHRIQIFDPRGFFIRTFGREGDGIGQFRKPSGVAVSPKGHLVVSDKDNHRIQVFEMNGTFIFTFGQHGTANGNFSFPWDVACNSQGHIVVSDSRNHRIQLFNSEGMFLNKYGYENIKKDFDLPRGVCFTPTGKIMVTDFNHHRIVVVNEDMQRAQFLGQAGSRDRQFTRPHGVVCDDVGNIIVCDGRNNRIQVFGLEGDFLWKFGYKNVCMEDPSGICLNPQGRIVVVDYGHNYVLVF